MRLGPRWCPPAIAFALLGVAGCQQPSLHRGGLDEIIRSGRLRVVVRPGFLRYAVPVSGGTSEHALLIQLAARLHVRLQLSEAARADQLLEAVALGRADLAVGRFAPAALRGSELAATAAVDWVEDELVASERSPVRGFNDLAGRPLHLHQSDADWLLPEALGGAGGAPELVPVPEEVPLESILERVRSGRYGLTIADSGLVDLMGAGNGFRVIGPAAERRPLVWAVRATNPHLLTAVNDFLFAEQVLSRTSQTAACRDLPEIRKVGVLRVVTRNSPTTCTVERGGLEGFEYDLVVSFGRRLRLRLELAIPPPGVEPLDWLETGHGDLAALHEPLDPSLTGRFLTSRVYREVDLVTVAPTDDPIPTAVEDLDGARIAASPAVAAWCRLLPLPEPMNLVTMRPGADALTALSMVTRGEADLAVIDEDTARIELAGRPGLAIGPLVVPSAPLTWVLNPSSPRLHTAVDGFLAWADSEGLIAELALSELVPGHRWTPPDAPRVTPGALSPFDSSLRASAREHGIDWRLVASVMYEESRFNPEATGPGGSAGLFQLMPFTWRELGVEDPHAPGQAIEAGTAYLSQLMDQFADAPVADRVAMAIAAFNVGPRHVSDARSLAREMGLDPDRWSGNVETALVLLDDPEVARRFPAGICRCRRAAAYARRILRRYRAYTEQFPPS